MTNERAPRIVDVSADTTAEGSIAPPPIDRADEESQLDGLLDDQGEPVAELEPLEEPDHPLADQGTADDEDPETLAEVAAPAETDTEAELSDLELAESEASEAAAQPDEETDQETDDEPTGEADGSLSQLLEALLFVADEPIAPSALGRALDRTPRQIRRGLDDLADALREENRGVRLQQGPDGAQLVTAPEAANVVELFLGLEANRRLSNAALETLAIVAYRQPVTRHIIEQIRGVSSDGAVSTLRARGLIEGIGRAPGPGRPLLFSTTQRFLEHFGLERPDELPPLPDDVELPPEDSGAQLGLDAAVRGSGVASLDAGGANAPASSGDLATDVMVSDTAEEGDAHFDDDDEFEPFDELEDDSELEISEDVEDLTRAAEVALAAPTEPADGSAE